MWYFIKRNDRPISVTGEELPEIMTVDFTAVRTQFPNRNRWDIFVLSLFLHLHHHFKQPVAVSYSVIDRYVVAFWNESERALNHELWQWLLSGGQTPLTMSLRGHVWRMLIGFDPFAQVGHAIERLHADGLLTYAEHDVSAYGPALSTTLLYQPTLPH